MSQQADQIRDRRRAFAAPGSPLDRAVRVLAVALPALVGAVVAAMLIAPLSPRGEVSFILDRNKVGLSEDRLRVDRAMYRGSDKRGRPFSVSAGEAVQASARVPIVRLRDLTAEMLFDDGPAVLSAPAGRYDIEQQKVTVDGLINFKAADGYRLSASGVSVSLPDRSLVGQGQVEGSVPAGTFRADGIRADLDERSVTLEGNARLRMVPGQMRVP
ncbi:MAG TPA: LPS export ABC transporter periplasmic protein LptC [Croceibacterium sp.]|nr:LPS export ABC transporter periplasmic protein LptC [Croceibacterium sp.]